MVMTIREATPADAPVILYFIRALAAYEREPDAVTATEADLLVGHSKGYALARELSLPLVRVGLPIHDRLGGQRQPHINRGFALQALKTPLHDADDGNWKAIDDDLLA